MDFWKNMIKRIKRFFNLRTTAGISALAISFYFFSKSARSASIPEVKLSYFLLGLSQNMLQEVLINGKDLIFKGTNSDQWYSTNAQLLTNDRLYKLLKSKQNLVFSCVDNSKKIKTLEWLVVIVGYYLGYKIVQQYINPTSSISKENLNSKVTFDDVYGLDQAKLELQEIIDFLNSPEKYQNIGARLRRGVLLYGPPGTGKTLLAKATAGESKASFLFCTASEFVELYVGMGPKRVRELFDKARGYSPCIIFIDEIDGIGMQRKSKQSENSDQERSSTLNQLLTEMDGFRENENVVVIAATNRVLLLDDALLRSGRFDTKIKVDMPSEEERAGIIKVHLKKKKHNISEELVKQIASYSVGFSGADIENMVNESAYSAIHNNRKNIQDSDMASSFEKIMSQSRRKSNQ